MEAQIRVSGGDETDEVADLWEWLRGERELAGAVRPVRSLPGAAELGGALDMLTVAVGGGGVGTVLAQSLITWLRTRRADITVIVAAKARTVTVKARDLDADTVMPLLRQILGDDDG